MTRPQIFAIVFDVFPLREEHAIHCNNGLFSSSDAGIQHFPTFFCQGFNSDWEMK